MNTIRRLRRYWRSRRPRLWGVRGAAPRRTASAQAHRRRSWKPWKITLLAGLLLSALAIGLLEARLRPMAAAAARTQAQNTIAGVVEHAILSELVEQGVVYSDLVTIQRDGSGAINALTADTIAMNRLRAELVGVVLETLDGVDVSQIRIPLGSLLDFDLIWGLGPSIKVHAMTVGTVEGEFQSQFSSAGVNQTLHKIDLELAVPLTLMLPGGAVEAVCETQIPIAETVIVGQVPQIFLQNGGL